MKKDLRRIIRCIGLLGLVVGAAGCPAPGPEVNSNTNDNEVNGNDNANGGEPEIVAGVEVAIPNEGADHIPVDQQATYQSNPPASGPHWSAFGVAPVAAGVYEASLEEEQWIHNLEHGYIVLLYDCGGPCERSLLDDLEALFDATPPSELFGNTKLVISAYDGLPFSFAVIAWDRQLHLETLDEEAILNFYTTWVDQAPEAVP